MSLISLALLVLAPAESPWMSLLRHGCSLWPKIAFSFDTPQEYRAFGL